MSTIELLREWVQRGAPDPRDEGAGKVAEEPGIDYEDGRKFWSFIRPVQHTRPGVKDEKWPRNGIDHFILARMEEAGTPSGTGGGPAHTGKKGLP